MYQLAAAQETGTDKSTAFFQEFLKTVPTLSINETKVTSTVALINNLFA